MDNTTFVITSVTRELSRCDSDLRELLRPHKPLLDRWRRQVLNSLSGRPWVRPGDTRRAWMSGLAIDYRVRWWLTGVDELPPAVLAGIASCPPLPGFRLLDEFTKIAGAPAGVLDPLTELRVCAVAIAAASVEPLYRAGPVPCALADLGWDGFIGEYAEVLDDVVALSAGLPALLGRYSSSDVACAPVAGVGRLGGDADFVAGSELVEIKCVVDPRRSASNALQQLLAYAARLRPESMALLLPRQHTLATIDLSRHGQILADLDGAICSAYQLDER